VTVSEPACLCRCPRTYHTECVGLSVAPEEEWTCAVCAREGVEYVDDSDLLMDKVQVMTPFPSTRVFAVALFLVLLLLAPKDHLLPASLCVVCVQALCESAPPSHLLSIFASKLQAIKKHTLMCPEEHVRAKRFKHMYHPHTPLSTPPPHSHSSSLQSARGRSCPFYPG
jgi:hypothetical protein